MADDALTRLYREMTMAGRGAASKQAAAQTPNPSAGKSDADIQMLEPLLPPEWAERLRAKVCADCVKRSWIWESVCHVDTVVHPITGKREKVYNNYINQRDQNYCHRNFEISPKAMRRFLKKIPVDKRPNSGDRP